MVPPSIRTDVFTVTYSQLVVPKQWSKHYCNVTLENEPNLRGNGFFGHP
jgi:hypothetical protein